MMKFQENFSFNGQIYTFMIDIQGGLGSFHKVAWGHINKYGNYEYTVHFDWMKGYQGYSTSDEVNSEEIAAIRAFILDKYHDEILNDVTPYLEKRKKFALQEIDDAIRMLTIIEDVEKLLYRGD
jgi:hypothetical protein